MKNQLLICFFALGLLMFIQGCTNNNVNNGILTLDQETTIPQALCQERGLENSIVVLESKYCGACKSALPKIKAAAEELKVDVTFLDLSATEDASTVNEKYKITPKYTPTMIAGCKVYIGDKTQEEFKSIISTFLNK